MGPMSDAQFRVFGLDRQVYGPVSVASLQEWARDGRIQRDSWIHVEALDSWRRAETVHELHDVFPAEKASAEGGSEGAPASSRSGVAPKVLQRLKLFGEFSPEELEPFAREMEEQTFRPFSHVVRQGELGESMYFILQGRVGVSAKGKVANAFLAELTVGDTFGEMSVFDPEPRSADVRAEGDVVVLKLSAESLNRVCKDAPAAGARFVWNVARLLSVRIRTMDRLAATTKDLHAISR